MTKRRVIVKGGGKNLYYINETGGRFYVTQKIVKPLNDDNIDLGSTRSLSDALSLITSHSGRGIESVD